MLNLFSKLVYKKDKIIITFALTRLHSIYLLSIIMINIAHPKVMNKPPISKFHSGKKKKGASKCHENSNDINEEAQKFDDSQSNNECHDCSVHESLLDAGSCDLGIDTFVKSIEKELKYHHHKSTSDCNHNVIEPNSCSFEQLCSMINNLEQNFSHEQEIVSVQTCFLPVEHHPIASDVKYLDVTPPEKDVSESPCGIANSTYDDIMTFLGTLDQDCPISEHQNNSGQSHDYSSANANKLESFIALSQTQMNERDVTKADLATALLKLEDRDATLKLLKEELKSERIAACNQLENQNKEHMNELQTQKTKYQNVVKRHQKFIEQLIEEKKQLSEKCNALAQKIKEMELKQQRELKVAIERHTVELQRAKELCQASEKIRRERWLEVKTSKIKEMTVKGLEPELRNMVDQHQQEIQEIRSAHMKELQDVELRAIRRSNQQLEQLRLELTASHDKILANEKEAMRLRYQEKFDEQESLIQTQQRKFFDELQQEKKKFADEQARRDVDRDASIQEISSQYQERIEKMMRQFEMEKKLFEENIETEREKWMENYKRQQTAKFEMAKTKIRDDSNRERDRQIELAISRLEKESRDMITNFQRTSDNKLQCLKDKYEADLIISREREKSTREKLTIVQDKSDLLGNNLQKIECKLGQCQADLNDANRLVDKIIQERDHAKKLARQEIESEKRELEEKISLLYKEIALINSDRETRMAQLYSRIKLIITQKDITIKNISKEANDIRSKCDHLEKLLNQQRKEYLLKTL